MPILKKKQSPDSQPSRREAGQAHPVRTALTALGGIGVVLGFPIWLESHYAKAEDIAGLKSLIQAQGQETKTGQEINRLTAEIAVLTIQRTLSEQQFDAIVSRPKPSTNDQINAERVKGRIAALDADIAAKQRLIDRLRAGR